MRRTRIFLSCGQDEARGEMNVARSVADALTGIGFEVYIAVEQQNLVGVKEAVFRVLEDAEYFLFVDFGRECLDGATDLRGSLFSHQELAVAAFLGKEVLAFREAGVRKLDGLSGFLQANAVEFTDRSALPEHVVNAVRQKGWQTGWYNDLSIEINEPPFADANVDEGPLGRFFHLSVRNRHNSKHANDCIGWLDSVASESTGVELSFGTVEFKWAGFLYPSTRIAARGYRLLDAFWVLHQQPAELQYTAFTDSSQFTPRISGPGRWILRYAVTSSTVRGAEAAFRLTLGHRLHEVSFEPMRVELPAA